jgi:hypothetical protein
MSFDRHDTPSQDSFDALGQTPQIRSRFDPEKHIIFKEPCGVLTMKDIGLADDAGVSAVAVSQPFSLFSAEAVQIMRTEIAKPEVRNGYQFASNIANSQLRGYARQHAPFTYDAWNHPKTAAIVSKLARIDLIPWADYEIAHINLSGGQDRDACPTGPDSIFPQDDTPIVGWHKDSYPFVCVLMLSDCTGMIGGETAVRTGNGNVIRIRGPTEGCAVVLQGRYVTHQALRPAGARERITAVTSWRPRSPFVKDDSELRTVRPISDLDELYTDFSEYRLEIVKQRIEHAQTKVRARRQAGEVFDTPGLKATLQEVVQFLNNTCHELVEQKRVSRGFVGDTPTDKLQPQP